MKKNTGFVKSCLLVTLLLILAVIAALAAFLFFRNFQNKRITANTPPSVLVNNPLDGDSFFVGETVLANAITTAQNPILRLEFWLDGILVDTQAPDPSLGDVITFYASTQLLITEGPHLFSVRVVDANGLVGQSLPIFIQGDLVLETTEIIAEEGQTLKDIADATGTDNDLLKKMNPNLGNGPLPGGSQVVVPAPGNNNPPGGSGPGVIPPAPLPIQPGNLPPLQIVKVNLIDFTSWWLSMQTHAPKAPTNLQAGYENCTVRLAWTDNSDNESYFYVWMQALGGPPKIIATLKGSPNTGPVWVEFKSPQTGIYSFWIEAVGIIGGQVSEVQWVGVTDLNCDNGISTQLTIEITDMYVSGNYDRAYCYLSVEGAPEKRIPLKESQFVSVLGNWGDVSNWTGSGSSFKLAEPMDNEVTQEGTCLGWQGTKGPDNLGKFSASAPSETWDGRRLELKGSAFTIGYRIQPFGNSKANGFYAFTDFNIPSPTKPWTIVKTSPDPAENDRLARIPGLLWDWNGDTIQLTSFTIFLDGRYFATVPAYLGGAPGGWSIKNRWGKELLLPSSCGGVYKFQVAANFGESQSPPGPVLEYVQPACAVYAKVTFDTFTIERPCQNLHYYFGFYASSGFIKDGSAIGSRNIYYNMNCGLHSFTDYFGTDNTIYLPIDNQQNPSITVGADFYSTEGANSYKYDGVACPFVQTITMPYQKWATYLQQTQGTCFFGTITYTVKGFEAPDGFRSSNPGIGPPIGP